MPKYYYLSLNSRFVFWRLKVVCAVFDPSFSLYFINFFMLSSFSFFVLILKWDICCLISPTFVPYSFGAFEVLCNLSYYAVSVSCFGPLAVLLLSDI